MAKLTVLNPEFAAQSCELPDGRITVGRSSKNMLAISDSSVSTQHCELLVDGNEIIVRELGSRNGTFVNGMRVQAQSGVLHGQTIRVGKIDLRLELDGAAESSQASTITAVFVMPAVQKHTDRARPTLADFHVTFAPVGAVIPESMTMFMPKVREEPPVPAFALPELKKPEPKRPAWLLPVAIAAGFVLLLLALWKFGIGH